jgi:uncharacterized membrane protein YgdD (TMEM256/DUF423 family)
MISYWTTIGAILAGLAVAAGAFAAHGLDQQFPKWYAGQTRAVAGVPIPLAQKYLADFKTAAEYQMFHALALIALGLLAQTRPSAATSLAGWCFVGGIVLFSGCLYLLTLTDKRWLGAIVPIGGVLFLVGWTAFAWAAWPAARAVADGSRAAASRPVA